MMITLFRTNIRSREQAEQVIVSLSLNYPNAKVTIDLDDSDRVLKLRAKFANTESVVGIVSRMGFDCSELD